MNAPTRRALLAALSIALLATLPGTGIPRADDLDEDPWAALRHGGHVALIRHALAPGTGDPANFALGECSTQRNLSEEGREQARRIGDLFRENGIAQARVFTSAWCRSRETAELLELGPVTALEPLDSFFRNRVEGERRTRALADWIAAQDALSPIVLVTHQVNITALTGVFPGSGEIVVVGREGDGVMVRGRIATR
ncbi:MAG TPA: histidine phosphatase family protein [Saliniramus sp.]|nr:histidine phosphatase family protein [Saliniramus sp.]